ncbi:2-C-methyl-D-erythritol 4-phosphate cytidylyltransferase [Caenispirillum salinarum AK4]|uniref:Bifunctional enzyme IspD/IspF n=1 Tax=Caenispirillum salinarum AK4 TaxID=1238182 RepID=K9H793_9PROT|nr:bifunctional 2-C-methyl-D-erythritol 4-phosphate cytidylyltransferase/2-C-methyl-D-erythritol 2,4-cyclodiphosphate synthase [Caenispirillum salinarum]EKV26493.1 2-C-methyl-D-erythritol 4-phosphate cytidylyltransferase [Caenispirillum salinarum AK4]
MTTVVALVVAAGRGARMGGGGLPKQYRLLGGRPVLRHSLGTLAGHPSVDHVLTVIHPDDRPLYEEAAAGLNLADPVPGGAERQDSVRLGLEAAAGLGADVVLIHDGARPFVDAGVIDRVVAALIDHDGAIPALPVADTLKRGDASGRITETVPRDGLWRAQTPQGFRFEAIRQAHRAAEGKVLTDDAAVLEAAGGTVVLVPGAEANVKITTGEDLTRAERLFDRPLEPRTGTGFDVHAFAAGGDGVQLCGVLVPYSARLAGHSDADVAWHAITDAILGAIGAADIGRHFPPTDEKWKGADSAVFLAHAARLVEARGGRIAHVDVTVICERPKIGPFRSAMRARTAEVLGLSAERVNVKGTTTEKLGFTGRREGIAAQAAATVLLPALF